MLDQAPVDGGARDSGRCERFVVAAPVGQSAICTCSIEPVAVLDELEVRVWVKASRPDVRLAVRVTMPRSIDNEGRPATAIVRGAVYSRFGQWQQLVLKGVPHLLAAEARVMRTTPGANIDSRQAYVDSILLLVPGEPNGVEVFTDDLEVDGIALDAPGAVQRAGFDQDSISPRPASGEIWARGSEPIPGSNIPLARAATQLHGSVMLVEERPFAPRVIEWQNEPFKLLAERGFNTVWLPSPPTADQTAEAARESLWFICSPPRIDSILATGIGRPDDRVIAWVLNDPAVELDPQYSRQWADVIRRHDASNRPILMITTGKLSPAGDTADIMFATHPRASSMPTAEYEEWLAMQMGNARPGMPVWAVIPTQLGEQACRQASTLAGTLSLPPCVDTAQVSGLVQTAWAHGCRGIIFRSSTPLDDGGSTTRQRAAMLEFTNRWLQVVDPWMAGGKSAGQIRSTDGAGQAVVLHVDRARLVVAIHADGSVEAGNNATPVASADPGTVEFVVPGVPESSEAYLLSPAVMRSLPRQRVAGGMRIAVPASAGAMVLITEDRQVIQSFRQRISRDAPLVARLERDWATERAATATQVQQRLAQLGFRGDFTKGDFTRTPLPVPHRDRARDQKTAASNPLMLSADQLVAYAEFAHASLNLRLGENLLYGGDFEDVGQMTHFGWVHVSRQVAGIEAKAKLSATQARSGQFCLELSAAPTSAVVAPGIVTSPPVWIVSPPVPVVEGQILEITGWVRIDTPITGNIDGLAIADSLGGPELSLAMRQTTGWHPFQMIRAAPQSGELRLTFALAGIGTACVDGVMIQPFDRPTIRRLPPVASVLNEAGPLLDAPLAR